MYSCSLVYYSGVYLDEVSKMKVSEHFKQALFYDQNSATDAFFEERASELFEPEKADPPIEIAFQTPLQNAIPIISPGRLVYTVRTRKSASETNFGFPCKNLIFYTGRLFALTGRERRRSETRSPESTRC